ncbi:L-fucose:H+ symporter permease [Halotalea alkalilenta]|uniref:MFS transporter n=1 Tax=Halotalea alkalilenta TaxID=376489 RepID=A0A172YEI6_9GAMM|nr:L-fucose:H+ symporter permease [Halotalea alkalilenta]ANF57680.1 MFS transporter [Halotalea alkalilenta]
MAIEQRGPSRYTSAIIVVTSIFFIWGFITCLNDILIPHLRAVFSLNYTQVMLIQFTFFGAYFIMSMPAGKVLGLIGYKNSISAGLLVAGIGALMFYPAAAFESYGLFLSALFVLASGITMLQVAANPYISLLGDEQTASSRLNLAQAFNSLGTTIAPAFGGLLILSNSVLAPEQQAQLSAEALGAYRLQEAQAVQIPYVGLAVVLALLAVMIYLWRLPSFKEQAGEPGQGEHSFAAVLRHRHVVFAIIGLFLYVGAEVSIGSFMINYLSLPEIGGISESQAAHYLSLYWGGAMVGRFVGAALMRVVRDYLLLGLFALVAGSLVLISIIASGQVSMWSIIAVGLFNSIMFPTLFTLGINRMGPLTGKASSLLIMAIVGGAILPVLQGALADNFSLQIAFLLPVLCYLYIAWYGFSGHRVRETTADVGGQTNLGH